MNKKIAILILALILVGLTAFQPVNAQQDYGFLVEISATSFLPPAIHGGDIVSMAVNIKNRGLSISIVDLEAELDIGSQFEPIELNDGITLIKAGSTKTLIFKFRVKQDTLPGYYPVFLTMNYTRKDSPVKETQSILVPVSQTEKNIDVTFEPTVINPGKQTEFVFTLKNVGGTPVSNISFSWEEENDLVLPIGSDNKRYISVLQPNEVAEVFYIVAADPNIAPGIYPLDINMTFIDVNGTRTQTSQVGLIIGGTTDFEVSAEILNTGQLSLSIANIGSNNAGAVVVRIPQQQGIRVSGSNIAILGNLNKGDFTLANFQIQSAFDQNNLSDGREQFRRGGGFGQGQDDTTFGGARTVNPLIIEIDYTDTTGERQRVQKTIQLSSDFSGAQDSAFADRFRQRANVFSFVPWVLLVLIVGGAIAFNRFKAGNSEWKKLAIKLVVITVLFLATIFLLGSNLLASIIVAIISVTLLAWFFLKKSK